MIGMTIAVATTIILLWDLLDPATWALMIGAVAAFFGLSNRMANMTGMRPNDEFYLMGRVPTQK